MNQMWVSEDLRDGTAAWILEIDPAADQALFQNDSPAYPDLIQPSRSSVSIASRHGLSVCFAGDLANRSELTSEPLTGQPTPSDADLLLDAYLRCGENLLLRMRGPFALFIWDQQQRTLTCARDHLGVQPIFWARAGSRWLFSDSALALAKHPQVASNVNRVALAEYLCHRWPPCEETFFTRVFRLPPGHLLRVQADRIRTERYWDPTPPDKAFAWLTEAEAGEFESVLMRAVRRCQGPGRTGIFLSGGIDSVTVAALTVAPAQQEGRPLPLAASLGFPHPDCNEEALQRSVAEQLGMPQILLPFHEAVGGRGLLPAAMEMADHWSAPLQNVWNPAYFRLALHAKAEGCDTILTGSGGDEWLGVDPIFAADLIQRGDLIGLLRLLETFRRSFHLPLGSLARNVLWNNGFRPVMKSAWRNSRLRSASHSMAQRAFPQAYEARRWQQRQLALSETPGWIAPDPALRRELDERWDCRRERSQPPPGAFYLQDAREFLDHPLTSLDFEEAHENGRRLGMQIRHPFWDPDLVQLLYRMPPQLLQQGGRSKGLVRGMLSRRFPELGFEKQKKVVSLEFFRELMLEEGAQVWKQIGGTSALGDLGIVDAKKVDAEVTQVLAGRDAAQSYRIWDFVAAEKWTRPRL